MKYFEEDKGFKILFIIYILILAADLITTLNMGELLQYLEANPLFKFGGLPLIILLNVVFAMGAYHYYTKGSIDTRFIVAFILVAVGVTRLIAVITNIAIYNNPPTLEQAIATTQAVKTQVLTRAVLINIFPFFNGIIAYMFFKYDHKIRRSKNGNISKDKVSI